MTEAARVRFSALLREDPVPEVRAEAARALGVVGESEESVAPLVDALADSNVEVRRAATLALGRIGSPAAVEALVGVLTERPELWREVSAALATASGRDLEESPAAASRFRVEPGAQRCRASDRRGHQPDADR